MSEFLIALVVVGLIWIIATRFVPWPFLKTKSPPPEEPPVLLERADGKQH